MVGFDTSIESLSKPCKPDSLSLELLPELPLPDSDLSIPEFLDFSLPLLNPVANFEWSDDWFMDSDTLNMPTQENPVPDCGLGSIEKPIEEIAPKTPLIGGSDGKMVIEEAQLGSLIQKVSLVGGVVSPQENEDGCERNLKLEDNGDGLKADDACMVVESENSLKLGENRDGAHEAVSVVVDSESILKLEQNKDVMSEVSLVNKLEKADEVTVKSEKQIHKVVSDEEDSDSSSSDSESETDDSSSASSSSSSSSEDEDEDEKAEEDKEKMEIGDVEEIEEGEILVGSDEDEEGILKGPIKSKNEIEDLPPVPQVNVSLEPYHQTLPVGVVLSVMGTKVVIEGLEKHNPLNEGSILWITETRSPLGIVDEIFGPVKNPYYIVRYNSAEEVPAGIRIGSPVSFVTEFANYVLNDNNIYKKGYDASGENDEELSEDGEFSDDEKEAEYRKAQRMADNGGNDKKRGNRKSGNRKKAQQQKGASWKNGNPPAQPSKGPNVGQPSKVPNMDQPSNGPNMGRSSNNPSLGHPSYNPNMGHPSNNPNVGHPSNNPNIGYSSNNPNQFFTPPFGAQFGSGTFGSGPNFINGSTSVPPASLVPQANFCTPQNFGPLNGGWMNGMMFQPQQQMIFPNGLQMNGMPPQQLNHHQLSRQMFTGFPNGMQMQQQFNPSQRPLVSMSLPFGQSNFAPGPSASWPGLMEQATANQAQFGMGFQGQPMNASQHVGESGSSNEQTNDMPTSSNPQGNVSAPQQFSQGSIPNRGGISHGRGRGRGRGRGLNFSGRRGHQ